LQPPPAALRTVAVNFWLLFTVFCVLDTTLTAAWRYLAIRQAKGIFAGADAIIRERGRLVYWYVLP